MPTINDQEKTLVFVYGTLKKGHKNHYLLSDRRNGTSEFIGCAKIIEPYALVIATRYNVPFLLKVDGVGNIINGEIYKVDPPMLTRLDELEDYPNYYDREVIVVNGDDGKAYDCWIYFLKSYPNDFLSNRQLYSTYLDPPECSYILPSKRPPNGPRAKDDMNYRPGDE